MNGMKIFSGNSNRDLTEEICRYLKVPLGDAYFCLLYTF